MIMLSIALVALPLIRGHAPWAPSETRRDLSKGINMRTSSNQIKGKFWKSSQDFKFRIISFVLSSLLKGLAFFVDL